MSHFKTTYYTTARKKATSKDCVKVESFLQSRQGILLSTPIFNRRIAVTTDKEGFILLTSAGGEEQKASYAPKYKRLTDNVFGPHGDAGIPFGILSLLTKSSQIREDFVSGLEVTQWLRLRFHCSQQNGSVGQSLVSQMSSFSVIFTQPSGMQ